MLKENLWTSGIQPSSLSWGHFWEALSHQRLFITLTLPSNFLWGMISITSFSGALPAITMQWWRSCCTTMMYTALEALVSYCGAFMRDHMQVLKVGFWNTKKGSAHGCKACKSHLRRKRITQIKIASSWVAFELHKMSLKRSHIVELMTYKLI